MSDGEPDIKKLSFFYLPSKPWVTAFSWIDASAELIRNIFD